MFTTRPRIRRLLRAFPLRTLLAAWLVLAPSAASARDAAPQVSDALRQAAKYIEDGFKRQVAGDVDAAIELFKKAVELIEKNYGPDDTTTAWALSYLGEAYRDKADFKEAERLLLRSVSIIGKALEGAEAGSDYEKYESLNYAKAVHGLGTVYDTLGDYARAQPLYERALALHEKHLEPDNIQIPQSLNFLGNLHMAKGDYALAAKLFERALAIYRKKFGPDHQRVNVLMNNLANAYDNLGDAAGAERLLKEALAAAEKRGVTDTFEIATYYNNLGNLYAYKRPAEGRAMLERALAIKEKLLGPKSPQIVDTLNNLGLLDWQEGDLKRAEQRLSRGLEILREVYSLDHPQTLQQLSNLAQFYAVKGDLTRAIALLTEGSKYSERNLLKKLTIGSEKEKQSHMASVAGGTNWMLSLHLRDAADDERAARLALNTILWRKGRVLDVMSGQIAAMLDLSDREGLAALAKLGVVRTQLSTLELKGPEDGAEAQYKARIEELESQIQSLEKLISERAAALGSSSAAVSVEAVQAAIPAGAALVELIQYRPTPLDANSSTEPGAPRYAAYVLKPTGAPAAIDLGDAVKIDAGVWRLRTALGSRVSKSVRPLARAVDEEVMRPVRKLLGDVKHVLVSPDGALNLVPFAALVDEQDRHLLETYTFTYLASGRDLLRAQGRASGAPQSPVVIANPLFENSTAGGTAAAGADSRARAARFGSRFTPLGGTSEEAREVTGILRGARTFTGAQATEAAVKQVKSPSILHIATHGFFFSKVAEQSSAAGASRAVARASGTRLQTAENPLLRSGLALAGANGLDGGQGEDGVLTALEAAALDLHATRLIVLSACETGVGEVQSGEGVYGMRRALALAGAESQLMSLWKVDDEATRDLMTGFYRKLVAGEGRSESLRQVQLKLLKSEEYSHPYFWAGFIMSGQWAPL